jgi:hypothetical protein
VVVPWASAIVRDWPAAVRLHGICPVSQSGKVRSDNTHLFHPRASDRSWVTTLCCKICGFRSESDVDEGSRKLKILSHPTESGPLHKRVTPSRPTSRPAGILIYVYAKLNDSDALISQN